MVERVLLMANRSSGIGCSPFLVTELLRELRQALGWPEELEVELVGDHAGARRAARRFLAASRRPAALIVGGGGGTLRAAVEGVCDVAGDHLPGAGRLRIAVLRMGSGNAVARRLGMAQDPLEAIRDVARSLRDGRTTRCGVIRCRFGTADGHDDVRHAVTMCGVGQFGRTPGDLARWHHRLRRRRALTHLVGIERLNNIEYMASAGGRLLASMVRPGRCERVEVTLGNRSERFRLLAGAVMNFGIAAIPFDPQVGIEEPAAGVLLLTHGLRLHSWRLRPGEKLRVTLVDRESVEFFLDEDPERVFGGLSVEIAGTLAFVPGSAWEATA